MGKSKKNKHTNGPNGANGHTNGHGVPGDGLPAPAPSVPGAKKVGSPYTQALPVTLDEAKRVELSGQLVEATSARVGKEAEIAVLREACKGLRDREEKLVAKLKKNSEEGQVECQDFLLPTNEVQTVRMDTGEVVDTRTADKDDLQEDMFGDGEDPIDAETRDESIEASTQEPASP